MGRWMVIAVLVLPAVVTPEHDHQGGDKNADMYNPHPTHVQNMMSYS